MKKPEITNVSLYDTDDVWAIVRDLTHKATRPKTVRVRHIVKPTRPDRVNSKPSWAIVRKIYRHGNTHQDHLEIALLRPDKYALPGMLVIARAADPVASTKAPDLLVSHLIRELAIAFGRNAMAEAMMEFLPTVHLREKVPTEERALGALDKAKHAVSSRKDMLESQRKALEYAYTQRDYWRNKIEELKEKIPQTVDKLRELEADVERREKLL